jgi:hypothetical protein
MPVCLFIRKTGCSRYQKNILYKVFMLKFTNIVGGEKMYY